MAKREPAKAGEDLRHMKEQQEKQEAVMEELHKPFDRSAKQLMQVVTQLESHRLGRSTEADPPSEEGVPARERVVIRHGETAWSLSGHRTGTTDPPLIDTNRRLAERPRAVLAKEVFARVFVSPLQRALETC